MRKAVAAMAATASDAGFDDVEIVNLVAISAMVGPVQALLEDKTSAGLVDAVRVHLCRLMQAYLKAGFESKTSPLALVSPEVRATYDAAFLRTSHALISGYLLVSRDFSTWKLQSIENGMATRKIMIKTPRRSKKISTPPVGREQVVAAVLDAASTLFAELPVEQVTTRALAERARVNLGLIHRHCGTKDDVLHAVMERYAAIFRRDVLNAPDLATAFKLVLEDPTQAAFVRTLAFVTLSGTSLETVISRSGALKETLRMAKQEPGGAIDESKIHIAWSLVLGWLLFKPFLLKASGTALSGDDISEAVTSHIVQMLQQGVAPRKPVDASVGNTVRVRKAKRR